MRNQSDQAYVLIKFHLKYILKQGQAIYINLENVKEYQTAQKMIQVDSEYHNLQIKLINQPEGQIDYQYIVADQNNSNNNIKKIELKYETSLRIILQNQLLLISDNNWESNKIDRIKLIQQEQLIEIPIQFLKRVKKDKIYGFTASYDKSNVFSDQDSYPSYNSELLSNKMENKWNGSFQLDKSSFNPNKILIFGGVQSQFDKSDFNSFISDMYHHLIQKQDHWVRIEGFGQIQCYYTQNSNNFYLQLIPIDTLFDKPNNNMKIRVNEQNLSIDFVRQENDAQFSRLVIKGQFVISEQQYKQIQFVELKWETPNIQKFRQQSQSQDLEEKTKNFLRIAEEQQTQQFAQNQIIPPQQIFKENSALALNSKNWNEQNKELLEDKESLNNFVQGVQSSYQGLVNYQENLQFASSLDDQNSINNVINNLIQENDQTLENYSEIKTALTSQELVNELQELQSIDTASRCQNPSVKQKLEQLDQIREQLRNNFDNYQIEILDESKIKLLVASKRWGFGIVSKYHDDQMQELQQQIVIIINRVLQFDYNEKQVMQALCEINQECKLTFCTKTEHHINHPQRICQRKYQENVQSLLLKYSNDIDSKIIKNGHIFQRLQSLILKPFDQYIEYGKQKNINIAYSDEFEKALIITLLNYSVIYSFGHLFRACNPNYKQYSMVGCLEMRPLCNDETNFNTQNLQKLEQKYNQRFKERFDLQQQLRTQLQELQQQVDDYLKNGVGNEEQQQEQKALIDQIAINSDLQKLTDPKNAALYDLVLGQLIEHQNSLRIIKQTQLLEQQRELLKQLASDPKLKMFLF
ncbi:hypothetical protein pb186bvf_008631 [Paramecium bursaria]